MWFVAFLFAALSATYTSPNCGPAGGSTPWACGAWRTSTPPPLGRAGAIMTDPDTGNRVLRVTQAGSFGEDKATAFKVFDGGWQRAWNADSTRFFVVPWGGRPALHRGYWLSFDARNMKTRSKAAAVPDEFSDLQWDQSDPDLIVGMSRGVAAAYNVRTKKMTRVFDPAAARWGAVPRVSAWGGRRVCIAEAPQDTGHRIACFHRDTGKAQMIDLRDQTIDGRPFPVTFQGKPASLPSTVGIHAITISPDGRSVAIDTHGNSMCSVKGLPNYAWTAVFLDLDAGAAYEWNTGCGSTHWAYGYDGVLMQSASAKWNAEGGSGPCASDSRGIARRTTDRTVDSSYVQTAPCSFFAQPTWDVAVHLSWTNNRAGPGANAVPVLLATTSSAGSGRFLANDIAAMETSAPAGQGRLWRFAQTWNDPVKSQCAFLQYSSPAISPDGRWALFPSNWRGQAGSGGVCTGGNRTDVFLFELK